MKNLNKNNNKKSSQTHHHIVISDENYIKLKSLGKLGDTFDKVLGDVLSTNKKNQIMMLESGQETLAAGTNNKRVANNNFPPSNTNEQEVHY